MKNDQAVPSEVPKKVYYACQNLGHVILLQTKVAQGKKLESFTHVLC